MSRKPVIRQAGQSAGFLAILAAVIFAPAGTVAYWQGWGTWGVFAISVLGIGLDLARRDPALLERRMRAGSSGEKRPEQRFIVLVSGPLFLALIIVSALDRRFGWSRAPLALTIAAELAIAVGFAIVFLVFRVNSHASSVIEVEAGQRVVATGPYRWVRHPMYAGALLVIAALAPALGSLAGLVVAPPLIVAVVLRLQDEEAFLARELPGYSTYMKQTRFRLVPFVW